MSERAAVVNSRNATPVLSGVVFVATLAAYVTLELNGRDPSGLVYLAGPVIAALFITGAVGQQITAKTAPMSATLDRVQAQTNGALTGGIETAVSAGIAKALPVALAAAGVLPPPRDAPPSPAGEGPSTATMPANFAGTPTR